MDSVISKRPEVGRMRIIFGSQFKGAHILLRIVHGCFCGKSNKFSKFLVPLHITIMRHIF